MIVTPKVSVGDLVLGMSESDVQALLGQPDSRREEADEADDVNIHLEYKDKRLALSFWGDCDFRLGTITVENKAILLDDKKLIGLSEAEFQKTYPDFELAEDLDDLWKNYEDTNRELDVWVAEGVVSSFSIGPGWEDDDDTPIWPNK